MNELFNHRFKRDILQTVAVQAGSLVGFAVLLVAVLPRTLSKTDLGVYLTFRALVATLYPLFTLGLDIAQARFLGFFESEPERRRAVPATAMTSFLVLASVSSGLYLLARPFLVRSFFPANPGLADAMLVSLIGTGVYRMVYTYFQGTRRMPLANLMQAAITIGGQLSAAVLILAGMLSTLTRILWFIALAPTVTAIPFVIILARHWTRAGLVRPLLSYAIPRVPHLLANGFLMSSAIILARYFYAGPVVGDIGMASRFFQLIEMLAYAFNMVLLPGVSALWGSARRSELADAMSRYANGVMLGGLLVFFGFHAVGPLAIRIALPSQYATAIPVLQLFAWCALPYMVYAMFQYTIHGVDHRPVHVLVDTVRLVTLGAVFAWGRSIMDWGPSLVIPASFVASYTAAGLVSFVYLKRRVGFTARTGRWIGHAAWIGVLTLLSDVNAWIAVGLFLVSGAWLGRKELSGLFGSTADGP